MWAKKLMEDTLVSRKKDCVGVSQPGITADGHAAMVDHRYVGRDLFEAIAAQSTVIFDIGEIASEEVVPRAAIADCRHIEGG